MEIATFLPTVAGQFCLLCNWLMSGISRHLPAAYQYTLRIAQRLSSRLWVFPSSFPILFWLCPVAVQQPLTFPSGLAKNGNPHPFSLKGRVFV
jgi:hypothetical protein